MNREIKFRAWHKEFGKMVYTKGNSIFEKREFSPFVFEVGFSHYPESEWEIMQWTGLKDNAGKEIYEGDIVNQEKWVSVGKYDLSIGIVKYKGVGFTCECIGDWFGSNADLNGNSEVIGNIYEHPELLESRHGV